MLRLKKIKQLREPLFNLLRLLIHMAGPRTPYISQVYRFLIDLSTKDWHGAPSSGL